MYASAVLLSVLAGAVTVNAQTDEVTSDVVMSLPFLTQSATGLVSLPFQTGPSDQGPSDDGQLTLPVESSATFVEDGPSTNTEDEGLTVTGTDTAGNTFTGILSSVSEVSTSTELLSLTETPDTSDISVITKTSSIFAPTTPSANSTSTDTETETATGTSTGTATETETETESADTSTVTTTDDDSQATTTATVTGGDGEATETESGGASSSASDTSNPAVMATALAGNAIAGVAAVVALVIAA